jgi:hypothetical protein
MTDIEQIRAVLKGSYAAISGAAGERDWKAHEQYFAPNSRCFIIHRNGGAARIQCLTQAEYRDSRSPFFQANNFWELETRSDISIVGNVATAHSYYDSFWKQGDAPFESGLNTVQLVKIGGEWKIASIMWEAGMAATLVAALQPQG